MSNSLMDQEQSQQNSGTSSNESSGRFGLIRFASQNSLDESSQRNQSNSPEEDEYKAPFKNAQHYEQAFSTLEILRKSKAMCDVILVAGEPPSEVELSCHRIILASSSLYFFAMFTKFEEKQKERIVIKGVDPTALSLLVNYMYTAEIYISAENVQVIFPAANLLRLEDVKSYCVSFLKSELHPSNCLGIRTFASAYDAFDLVADSDLFIQFHFAEVVEGEEFLALESEEEVGRLISSDKLTVPSEEKVFEAVLSWINHDPERRKQHVEYLMDFVRFPLLSQEYLLSRVENEPLLCSSPKCKDLLIEALKFHLLKDVKPSAFTSPRTIPRQPIGQPKVLLVIGGQAPKAIRCVEAYCFKEERWRLLSDIPTRRCRSSVAVVDGKVYNIGGFNGSLRVKSVDCFDPQSGKWSTLPSMINRRSTLGVASIGSKIFAVGGFDGSSGLCSAEMFDTAVGIEWESIAPMQTRRSSVGVSALNGKIYAVGGYCGISRQCLNSVECYSPEDNTWVQVSPMSTKRSGASVISLNGLLFAIGGHEGPVVRNSCEVYDPALDSWKNVSDMSICRRNAGVVIFQESICVIGGDDGTRHLSSCEVYDPKTDTWTLLNSSMCVGRSYAGCCVSVKPVGYQ